MSPGVSWGCQEEKGFLDAAIPLKLNLNSNVRFDFENYNTNSE